MNGKHLGAGTVSQSQDTVCVPHLVAGAWHPVDVPSRVNERRREEERGWSGGERREGWSQNAVQAWHCSVPSARGRERPRSRGPQTGSSLLLEAQP